MTALAEASLEIRQVQQWLLRPSADTLDACRPALERAAAQITELLHDPPQTATHLLPAALELAADILQAQALLAGAGELYFGRLRRLSESATS